MDTTPPAAAVADPAQWATMRGRAPGLQDISGQLRLEVAGARVGVLKVNRGEVEIEPDGDAPALMAVDSQPTLLAVLGGEMHPFVAFLKGRLQIQGDRALALRITFGLQAGSPWSGLTPGK